MEHFVLIKKYGFSEVFLSQISQENHLEPARVLSQEKGFYRIITDKGESCLMYLHTLWAIKLVECPVPSLSPACSTARSPALALPLPLQSVP